MTRSTGCARRSRSARGWAFRWRWSARSEIRALHPFYNLDGVQAALHTPDDGHVDPAGAAFALAKQARASWA